MQTLCTVVGVVTLSLVALTCVIEIIYRVRQPSREKAIREAIAAKETAWISYLFDASWFFSEDDEILWLLQRIRFMPAPGALRDEWRSRRKAEEDDS